MVPLHDKLMYAIMYFLLCIVLSFLKANTAGLQLVAKHFVELLYFCLFVLRTNVRDIWQKHFDWMLQFWLLKLSSVLPTLISHSHPPLTTCHPNFPAMIVDFTTFSPALLSSYCHGNQSKISHQPSSLVQTKVPAQCYKVIFPTVH